MELTGKVALLTGAGNGIGAAMAIQFARDGAEHLVIADHDLAGAESVAAAIRDEGGSAEACAIDVSSEDQIRDMIDLVVAQHGRIDLLVSNAGVFAQGGPEADDAVWDRCWSINVMAHVHAARAALPHMLARGEGYILNTASSAGLLTALGAAPYAVTKHAAVAFAEWLAITYGDRGIRVSVLCPQAVRTAMLDAASAGQGAKAVASAGDVLTPSDVAVQVRDAIRDERFLILTHAEIGGFMQRKAADTDRWIGGMRRFAAANG